MATSPSRLLRNESSDFVLTWIGSSDPWWKPTGDWNRYLVHLVQCSAAWVELSQLGVVARSDGELMRG